MNERRMYQLKNKISGHWWAGNRGWSKNPKIYKRLCDLRSAITYHKDWWIRLNKEANKTVIDLVIVEFKIEKHSTYPVNME